MKTIKSTTNRPAFTLVELAAAVAIAAVVMAPVAVAMINSHRMWQRAYERTFADVVIDSYAAGKRFESIIRKAAAGQTTVDVDAGGIEAQYYDSADSNFLDRYAYIYVSGESLLAEYGVIDEARAKASGSTYTICENVSSCTFNKVGDSAQMVLTLDDGEESRTIVSSALMHN